MWPIFNCKLGICLSATTSASICLTRLDNLLDLLRGKLADNWPRVACVCVCEYKWNAPRITMLCLRFNHTHTHTRTHTDTDTRALIFMRIHMIFQGCWRFWRVFFFVLIDKDNLLTRSMWVCVCVCGFGKLVYLIAVASAAVCECV